ncbi:hypothetical protein OE88DRAFT_1812098 [Heliocybe sulcata]|uniref:F-box domain-containing protein n=1 Tax=Heliocybe sulcata TaxID=5364 RepID=A0A5C3MPV7_9AGAM|nr:hypothetical protein OE88DRAFT_1812098 [Heliocybe sulcata]
MAQFTELPAEILFMMIKYLSVEDMENLRSTCKAFYTIMEDAALWRRALCTLLSVPINWVMAIVQSKTINQLRKQARKAALMTERWHLDRPAPRRVRSYLWPKLQDVLFIPGGDWLVCMFEQGTLQVRRVETMEIACSLQSGVDTSMFSMSCISVSPEGNFYALFHCTERILIYEIRLTPDKQSLRVVDKLSRDDMQGIDVLRHASLAGNVVALDCYYQGQDLVYMRTVKPGETGGTMHAALIHDHTHCTIHILSSRVVLLCNGQGISVYKTQGLVGTTKPSVLDIVSSDTIWSVSFDSWTSGQLSGSPAIWKNLYDGHQGPLMILGAGVLHIVQPSVDLDKYSLRSFRVPEIVAEARAVGTRYAFCAQTEQNRGLVFKTCTFPRVLQAYDEIEDAEDMQVSPGRVNLGSFLIEEVKDMSPVFSRLDEWTGYACVMLENDGGVKRLVIVDVI